MRSLCCEIFLPWDLFAVRPLCCETSLLGDFFAVRLLRCEISLLWDLFAVRLLCYEISLLWDIFAMRSLCCETSLLWDSFAVRPLCCETSLLWDPFVLSPLCYAISSLWDFCAVRSLCCETSLLRDFNDFQRSVKRKLDFQTSFHNVNSRLSLNGNPYVEMRGPAVFYFHAEMASWSIVIETSIVASHEAWYWKWQKLYKTDQSERDVNFWWWPLPCRVAGLAEEFHDHIPRRDGHSDLPMLQGFSRPSQIAICHR